jgi:hypothetical protein
VILPILLASVSSTQETVSLLWDALQTGGSAAIALVAIGAWWFERTDRKAEREDNRRLQEKIIEMAMTQVVATEKHEQAIRSMTESFHQVFPRQRQTR